MKLVLTILLFNLLPFFSPAQLDRNAIQEVKTYTSIEEALQNKDSVFKLDLSRQKTEGSTT